MDKSTVAPSMAFAPTDKVFTTSGPNIEAVTPAAVPIYPAGLIGESPFFVSKLVILQLDIVNIFGGEAMHFSHPTLDESLKP